MKRNFRRRSGAFDRYLSNQVDSAGTRVLNQKPLSKAEEEAYMEKRRLGMERDAALRIQGDLLRRQHEQRQEDLKAQYKAALAEAVACGWILEE